MSREGRPARVPETDKQAGEDPWQRHGSERGVWTEPMLTVLERGLKGNKWFSLIDKVVSERTLGIAWEPERSGDRLPTGSPAGVSAANQKVESNAGACGVDHTTVRQFAKDSQRRLLAVKEQISECRYEPRPVRRVHIPKAGSSETRPLGIPTVTDRVVQTALKMVLEPIFESKFAPTSHGFYPSCLGL